MKDIPTIQTLEFSSISSILPTASFINRDGIMVSVYRNTFFTSEPIPWVSGQVNIFESKAYTFSILSEREGYFQEIVLERGLDEERANEFIRSQMMPII